MHRVIARLPGRAREERGFTMVTVMAVMLCVTLLSIAALAAAQGDLGPGAHDRGRKVAYAAAEAGVQNYLFHLAQDPNYWTKCTTGAAPHAVNNPWNGVSPAADPRTWAVLEGGASRYTIELLPANGTAACSTANPDATTIDTASGTFKIRATGEDVGEGAKRSIVATFRRKSFLDYLYFTDKETRAAGLYGMNLVSRVTREKGGAGRDLETWAKEECDRYWGNDPALGGRGLASYVGEYQRPDGVWVDTALFPCNDAEFKADDVIAGPLHTNDEILIECASPFAQFGDSIDDVVETSSLGQTVTTPANPKGGWRDCTAPQQPRVNFADTSPAIAAGTWKPRAAPLELPLTNATIKRDTAPAYRFEGTTKIVMSATTMRVTGTREDGTSLTDAIVAIPDDGAVYVSTDGTCPEYTAVDSGAAPNTCGNLELEGDYAADVTFAAENDILLTGGVTRTAAGSQFLLGLIATNFIRVHHPVTNCSPDSPMTCNYVNGCTNAAGTLPSISIEGALLSLTKSFLVDNWFCGAPLGTLRVYGAIAQKFRGPVTRDNTGVLAGASGYVVKDYIYDTKFKYRSPPLFLDPVQAQWRVQTFSEQVPAR